MNSAEISIVVSDKLRVPRVEWKRVLRTAAAAILRCALALALLSLLLLAAVHPAWPQTESVIHSFTGYPKDGQSPFLGTLIRDKTGKLYGTTNSGGAHQGGTVFRITFTNTGAVKEKVLYSFTFSDGKAPYGGLVRDKLGNLYGTTAGGGTGGCAGGCGTVFKLTKTSVETVLHNFNGPPGGGPDGAFPYAGLLMDAKGNLYGTTVGGGTTGNGTVFKITAAGVYSVLYNFAGAPDGSGPVGGVILDAAGNLYGTTASGGVYSNSGTIFKVTAGGVESVLHNFDIFTGEGAASWGALLLDSQGNLYGTTNATVFEFTAAGVYTVLYTFGQPGDGSGCFAGLVMDAAGNLYGTTLHGGNSGLGTVFEVSGPGSEKVLHSFGGNPDGANPQAGLVMDPSGNLYGITDFGGTSNDGTVFKVVP